MLKLYKLSSDEKEYWETWDNRDRSHSVHWGKLGTRGDSRIIKDSLFTKAVDKIQKEMNLKLSEGFEEIEIQSHDTLMIEYSIDGMGTVEDLDKRHRLEDRMNETLGWTGLGHCDGGSSGSGTMEVCNLVVDFDLAKKIIEEDLADTEFNNYTRIYDQNSLDT